jgi:Flp pilus assembly protein TadD
MDLSVFRKAPLAALLMLGCAAVPAHAGWFNSDPKPAAKTDGKAVDSKATDDKAVAPAATLDDSIRQAQMLRLDGQYPEAVKHLSQLMMVASDDARVISEYGKTLTAMGRASDGVSFLTRAQQLQPGDWTIYSAMGVAYDQIGDQKSARAAYVHALSIKPDEPSVLNNYALSRMLDKDPDMARQLAARAESAGGTSDAKIARNIAMIRSLAPETPAPPVPVAHNPATPSASVASNPVPVPTPVKVSPLPQVTRTQVQTGTAHAPDGQGNRVVMQPVPVDPLAGPVHAKPNPAQIAAKPAPENSVPVATQAPRPLQPKQTEGSQAEPSKPVAPASIPDAGKPVPVAAPKVAAPMKAIDLKPALVATASKTSSPVPVKPASLPLPAGGDKAATNTVPPVLLRTGEAKPASSPVKAAEADKPAPSVSLKMAAPAPVKTADTDKPASAPKVLPPKTAAKDTVPGLRMSANAY